MKFFSKILQLAGSLIGLAPSLSELIPPERPQVRRYEIPTCLPAGPQNYLTPGLPPKKFKRLKTSTRARLANVYGVQTYAGADFISYAEHDRRTRERMASPTKDDGLYAGYLAAGCNDSPILEG